jgi:pyridoxine 5-phosphate synthase
VPERRAELTTEGGLDVRANFASVHAACTRLGAEGIEVSLFIDADPHQVDASVRAGAPVIELHTGQFADARNDVERRAEFDRLAAAAHFANEAGLRVHAGHGLHYHNVLQIGSIRVIQELNIGHAIIARALFCGIEQAVREMKALLIQSRLPGAI